jgi:RHS repeat-associated protein
VCELDASGNVMAVNTFGAQGLLSRHVTSTNASTFYTFDERGNVAQRTDGTGAVLSTDLYDAYGKLLAGGASGTSWGFEAQSGYYTDSETGLVLCTHRYYDPQAGRFLTRDPLGYAGGINLYGYTANDPVNEEDPDGTDKFNIQNPGHKSTSQNAGDVFAYFHEPTVTYNHQSYIIDIPNGQNLDRNLADARRFRKLLEDSGLNYFDQLQMKHDYLNHFCGNGGVGDYGKNYQLYPDSDPSKNNTLHWQRRTGGNFNLGSMGGALGFSEESLLTAGQLLSVSHNSGLHRQIEQDAIEDGFLYQQKH